mgnify:FL=1
MKKLVIEGNDVYEIDEECIRQKQKEKEDRKEKEDLK